jgi:hypothetical protein
MKLCLIALVLALCLSAGLASSTHRPASGAAPAFVLSHQVSCQSDTCG